MIAGNKFFITYNDYERRFHNRRRPALARYHVEYQSGDSYYDDGQPQTICTVFLDGKKYREVLPGNPSINGRSYSLLIVEPFHSQKDKFAEYNLIGKKFDPNSVDDWIAIFKEIEAFSKNDGLAFAPLAIALERFSIPVHIIPQALNSFSQETRDLLLNVFDYISWSLSPGKIRQLKDLSRLFNRVCPAIYPEDLIQAAKKCHINYEDLPVHTLTDFIISSFKDNTSSNPTGFLKLLSWLGNTDLSLSIEEISRYFPYVGETMRGTIIKRYFYDVRKGTARYDHNLAQSIITQNYEYYSRLRYVFEKWPANRNVQTEFFLDCLVTYEQTNQQRFQVTDGILDWAIQKAIQMERPIDLNFMEWLSYCEGGVIVNQYFTGFANFEIQYELDDLLFEEDSLKSSIDQLIRDHCTQLYHYEKIPLIDSKTNQPILDTDGQPSYQKNIVYEQRWRAQNDSDKEYVDLFVNWDKGNESDNTVFSAEMIDYSIVRENVERFIINHYGESVPFISSTKRDNVLEMFGMPIRMRTRINREAQLGENPGVELPVIIERVERRLKELFGDSMECDYDPEIMRQAQTDSQYSFYGRKNECFELKRKRYRRSREIYCTPRLSDYENLLTGRKVAICQNDLCFVTCIKENPSWENYKLIHVLDIIGYPVLEKTEAGFIPCQVYNQFVNQINRAVSFYRRLVCKDCGHILFPARNRSRSYFKCLLTYCPQCNVEVYLNYCHNCKKGLIDSRETKKCPNGLYICPDCSSCCSDEFFEFQANKYSRQGIQIPSRISRYIGRGHNNASIYYCAKCGSQKTWDPQNREWRCYACNPHIETPPAEDSMWHYESDYDA